MSGVSLFAGGPCLPAPTKLVCTDKSASALDPLWDMKGGIWVPKGTKREMTRLRRIPYKSGKRVEMRIVVDIAVKSKLNITLYRAMKLPPGWRKSPRQGWKNDNLMPVRIYTYQPLSLSGEELSNIQAFIALMETT